MANVDLITGKIRGAVQGTKQYEHEVGHIMFEDLCSDGNLIRVMQDLSFKTIVFATAFYILMPFEIFKGLILLSIIFSIFAEMYEEYWCWNFAKKSLREKERAKRRKKIEIQQVRILSQTVR